MEMEKLLLLLSASAGATFIVVASTIFSRFRRLFFIEDEILSLIESKQKKPTKKESLKMFFGTLFHCPLCFGFWMTSVLYLFVYGIEDYNFFIHFACACAGSATSMLFYSTINK